MSTLMGGCSQGPSILENVETDKRGMIHLLVKMAIGILNYITVPSPIWALDIDPQKSEKL